MATVGQIHPVGGPGAGDAGNAHALDHRDAMAAMQIADHVGGFGGGNPAKDARRRFDQRDIQPQLAGDGRRLQPDIAAADHHQPPAGLQCGLQRGDVGNVAHHMHAGQRAAHRLGQATRRGAQRQGQLVIGIFAAIRQHALALAVDALHRLAQMHDDGLFVPPFRRTQRQPVQPHLPQQIGLGQRRALIGRGGFVADHRDRALMTQRP